MIELGRQKLLLLCGLGMVIGHLVSTSVFMKGCNVEKLIIHDTIVDEQVINYAKSSGILMLIFTVVFVACFCTFMETY